MTSPFLAPDRDPNANVGRAKKSGTTYYSIPGFYSVTVTTGGPGLGTDAYEPFYVSSPIVVDELAAEVTTLVAASNFRIGIYAATADWQPLGAPLVDSGNLASATTGVKTYTLGTPLFLRRGRYVKVVNTDSNIALRAFVGLVPGAMFDTVLGATPFPKHLGVTRAYAAFPTPGTPWDTLINSGAIGLFHMVVLRVLTP